MSDVLQDSEVKERLIFSKIVNSFTEYLVWIFFQVVYNVILIYPYIRGALSIIMDILFLLVIENEVI